jgi:hypothetical protein
VLIFLVSAAAHRPAKGFGAATGSSSARRQELYEIPETALNGGRPKGIVEKENANELFRLDTQVGRAGEGITLTRSNSKKAKKDSSSVRVSE